MVDAYSAETSRGVCSIDFSETCTNCKRSAHTDMPPHYGQLAAKLALLLYILGLLRYVLLLLLQTSSTAAATCLPTLPSGRASRASQAGPPSHRLVRFVCTQQSVFVCQRVSY
jgi:hypothetical protein